MAAIWRKKSVRQNGDFMADEFRFWVSVWWIEVSAKSFSVITSYFQDLKFQWKGLRKQMCRNVSLHWLAVPSVLLMPREHILGMKWAIFTNLISVRINILSIPLFFKHPVYILISLSTGLFRNSEYGYFKTCVNLRVRCSSIGPYALSSMLGEHIHSRLMRFGWHAGGRPLTRAHIRRATSSVLLRASPTQAEFSKYCCPSGQPFVLRIGDPLQFSTSALQWRIW